MKDKKYPILIDEEGGTVTRLSKILDNTAFNQKYFGDIYKINKKIGIALYKNYINTISNNLKKLGININTTPVLDLYKKKAHKIIGTRSYSENPIIVNELGRLCVSLYKKNKIVTILSITCSCAPLQMSVMSSTHFA